MEAGPDYGQHVSCGCRLRGHLHDLSLGHWDDLGQAHMEYLVDLGRAPHILHHHVVDSDWVFNASHFY